MSDIHTTNKIKRLFDYTKRISKRSDHPRIRIGCIAVYKNDIISIGFNQIKTHTIQKEYNSYRELDIGFDNIHAEINCLSKISYEDYKADKIAVYIYREDLDGNIACARPCRACMKYMVDCGIHHIYYTMRKEYVYEYIGDTDAKNVLNIRRIQTG